jgi:chemotaxis protein MotA
MFESNFNLQAKYLATILIAVAALYVSIVTEFRYFDLASIFIVFGGIFLAGLVSSDYEQLVSAVKDALNSSKIDPSEFSIRINYFAEMATIKRNHGEFSLENFARKAEVPMIKKGLQLIADGIPIEELRHSLSLDYRLTLEKKRNSVKIINQLATVAPAAGLIGTVVGLVQMLGTLENSLELTQGLSVALLTTLYGAVISYLILQPLANKLESHIETEDMLLDLTLEGLVSIAQGYNPQLLKERLEAFAA